MLKATDIQKISKLIKVPVADLEKAIKDPAEVDVTVADNLSVLTTEELETRDTNSKNDGIKIGKEIGVKEVRTKAGLEDSVGKDPDKVAQAIAAKAVADAKIEPDKKVTQLTEQIGLLQKSIGDKDAELSAEKIKSAQAMDDSNILAAFPKNRNSLLSDQEYLNVVKGNLQFEKVDGKTIVKKGGEVLRDANSKNPIEMGKAIGDLFTERKWLDGAGGAGSGGAGGRAGGDGGGGGAFTKRSQVIAHYESQGKTLSGRDGIEISAKLAELKKANPDFDLNS
jgi:hypothetical protein